MKIYKGRFYYDFQQLIPKLIKKQNGKCFICGAEENLQPHHLKKAKAGNSKYADENNCVILCEECHNSYHQKYNKRENGGINPKTFMYFKRDYDEKQLRKMVYERNMLRNRLRKTENKLKKQEKESEKKILDNEYNSFVELYNDYNVSVTDIIQRIGNYKYRLFRYIALDSGDIVQRPKGLRFK